ncbi:MAG TPA: type II toxin-antitoxin system RelE/ParE family toxin [Caldilineaceae bacterium]|nr:type II toxin-antitoxin system RelE/ParE family toxin [Caldilineaceae bacterium]
MIVSFYDRGSADLFNRLNSRDARRVCPEQLWTITRRKLDQLNTVVSLDSLRIPPGNRLEALQGERFGQYSIRINAQYRICFRWTADGPADVEVVDYH